MRPTVDPVLMVTLVSDAETRVRALRALGKLPPFSPVLTRLMVTLADEEVSFAELSELIEKDSVMAGNVLRVVNSALYSWRGTVNSVRHAVSLLGFAKLRNTVMTLSVARMLSLREVPPGWSPAQFNFHAVASAILADLIAAELDTDYPEGAFAAGLLQNVGMMLLALGVPREYERVRAFCEQNARPQIEAEQLILGLDHTELSAEALSQWNLPLPIRQAVARHHGPHKTGEIPPLSRVVETADQLAGLLGIPVQAWMPLPQGDPAAALAQLGLAGQASRILSAFEAEFDVSRGFFR